MQHTMSTIGCPTWDLKTICERAIEYGFDGIDFRGLQEDLDITQTKEFTDNLNETKELVEKSGLEVSAISSSIGIGDETLRQRNLQEAKRLIPVANELDVEYIRVFGQGDIENRSRSEVIETATETITEILQLDGSQEIQWLVETHDHWIRGEDCKELLNAISNPNVGILWDIGHTTRISDESLHKTYNLLESDVKYIHLKDAIYDPDHQNAMDDGWRYVPPGSGELPLASALQLLQSEGYNGWIMFEHEKRWHPELSGPETAYPNYLDWFRSLELQ